MQSFRDQLLRGPSGAGPWPATAASVELPEASEVPLLDSLDIKFTNALARELDTGEIVVMQIFQPPKELRSGSWLLSRRRSIAGDLLALTGRRLLWITDRERGYYSRFGSIASYAPIDAVVSIGLTSGRGGDMLQVDLNSGSAWQFPMASESREGRRRIADGFAATLQVQKLQVHKRRNGATRTESR